MVALFHIFSRVVCRFLHTAPGCVSVEGRSVPTFTSQKLIYRHIGPLPLDIPQGHVHAAERVVEDGAVPPVGTNKGRLKNILDLVRVFANEKRFQIFVHRCGNRERSLRERSTPKPIEPRFAGYNFHDHQSYPVWCRENGFYIGNLQHR
jgi:hypothetical protein